MLCVRQVGGDVQGRKPGQVRRVDETGVGQLMEIAVVKGRKVRPDIKLGIYACDMRGGQTALENFSFSSAYAYMIRDGQIVEIPPEEVMAGTAGDEELSPLRLEGVGS